MNREEAIKVLKKSIDNSVEMTIREWEEFDKELAKAIDMAIEALSAETTATNTEKSSNCGDLISRADAIEALENLQTEQWIDSDIDYNNGLQSAIAEIRVFPSAEAEQGGDAKMTGTQPYMQQSRHDDGRMTREEAMYLLNNLRSVAEGKEDEAIGMAIEALSAEIPTKCIAQININADEIVKKIKDDYCSYGERRDESEVE